MTREEFMEHAEKEIDQAFRGQKNRMMNLVEQAWAEGKRNAEIDGVASIVKEVLDKQTICDGIHKTAKLFRKPLVRCKDCDGFDMEGWGNNEGFCNKYGFPHKADFYCADGERRTD